MRGTHLFLKIVKLVTGIIPAYAGNTFLSKLSAVGLRDHPRVCGEHLNAVAGGNADTGSSPRMRGTHSGRQSAPTETGIIPAYAGNTHAAVRSICCVRDHPRVCGEHWYF